VVTVPERKLTRFSEGNLSNLKLKNSCSVAFTGSGPVTKEFISKTTPPHPCPLPPGERGLTRIMQFKEANLQN